MRVTEESQLPISKKKRVCLVWTLLLLLVFSASGCSEQPGIGNYNRGVEYFSRKQVDRAKDHYILAIGEAPDLAEAHINLGLIYMNEGELDLAEDHIRTGIETLERDRKTVARGTSYEEILSVAYGNLGILMVNRARTFDMKLDSDSAAVCWESARGYFEEALVHDPENQYARDRLAEFFGEPGEPE